MRRKIGFLPLAALVAALLVFPGTASAQEGCPYIYQGDIAMMLAEAYGLVEGDFTEAEAVEALTAAGIYPGALPDILPPSDSDGWEAGQLLTRDFLCGQMDVLIWAAATNGLIDVDPTDAVEYLYSLALDCGIVCEGPPPVVIPVVPPVLLLDGKDLK